MLGQPFNLDSQFRKSNLRPRFEIRLESHTKMSSIHNEKVMRFLLSNACGSVIS
jgi:hypothetical protein